MIKWRIRNASSPQLLSGTTDGLAGHAAVFTVNAKSEREVSAKAIAEARALATKYGGTYGGYVRADSWVRPRIVAAYTTVSGPRT